MLVIIEITLDVEQILPSWKRVGNGMNPITG
jgi:hypothetical protein